MNRRGVFVSVVAVFVLSACFGGAASAAGAGVVHEAMPVGPQGIPGAVEAVRGQFTITFPDGSEVDIVGVVGAGPWTIRDPVFGLDLEVEPRRGGPSGIQVAVFNLETQGDGSKRRVLLETTPVWTDAPAFVGPFNAALRLDLHALDVGACSSDLLGVGGVTEALRPIAKNGCCVTCGTRESCCQATVGCCEVVASCGSCRDGDCD